jgi:diacylglycerol kinase family enzyme
MRQTMTSAASIPEAPPTPRVHRVEAVVNVAGGSVDKSAADNLAALVSDFGLTLRVVSAEAKEVEAAVHRAVAADPDLVIVLAGDGTARLAAQLCGAEGPLVAALPGGTMNVLPDTLYGGLAWQDALKAILRFGQIRSVSGGAVEGYAFYVAAILGAPALWAPAREAIRSVDMESAWKRARRALRRAFSGKMRSALDGGPGVGAEALAVICPLVSKISTDETAFEASSIDPESAAEAFRLGMHMLLGDWRRDPSVSVERCSSVLAWARRPIPCVLDGEPRMLGRHAKIDFRRTAFRALVPKRTEFPPK